MHFMTSFATRGWSPALTLNTSLTIILLGIVHFVTALPTKSLYAVTDDSPKSSTPSSTTPTEDDGGSGGGVPMWTNFLSTIIIWAAIIFACTMCCKGLCHDWCHNTYERFTRRWCCACCWHYRPFRWCCHNRSHRRTTSNGASNSAFEGDGEVFSISRHRYHDPPPEYHIALNMPRPPKEEAVPAEVIEMNELNNNNNVPTTSGITIEGVMQETCIDDNSETENSIEPSPGCSRDPEQGAADDTSNDSAQCVPSGGVRSSIHVDVHSVDQDSDFECRSYYSYDSQLPSYEEALEILKRRAQNDINETNINDDDDDDDGDDDNHHNNTGNSNNIQTENNTTDST